jgi:hypothetical protein
MGSLSFHHDEPYCHQFLVSFAPPSTSQGYLRPVSGEVVPVAQHFAGRLEQSGMEAARSFEGSRASFHEPKPSAALACGLRCSPCALLSKDVAHDRFFVEVDSTA